MLTTSGWGSSPHTRGARGIGVSGALDRRIIPAYAGSTKISPAVRSDGADHPRIRGEHPCGAGDRRIDSRIIPAYAGSTRHWRLRRTRSPDHPRIRGEHAKQALNTVYGKGSSPHTRGARRAPGVGCAVLRIIPAYAGSTFGTHRVPIDVSGSSPHTRGALESLNLAKDVVGIIPAYAGSTTAASISPISRQDHPRIRGEHARLIFFDTVAVGSSPHTRGARMPGDPRRLRFRIIPAYAGSTTGICQSSAMMSDHPRIRGEHTTPSPVLAIESGSSPHTRGARLGGARRH